MIVILRRGGCLWVHGAPHLLPGRYLVRDPGGVNETHVVRPAFVWRLAVEENQFSSVKMN